MRYNKIPQGGNMKKLLVIAALLALTFTAFGQVQLSVGGGASFSPTWMSNKATFDVAPVDGETMTLTNAINALSISAFVDATYVQAYVGYAMTLGDLKATEKYSSDLLGTDDSDTSPQSGTWLVIGALGKYPFKVGSMVVFPLLGAEYDLNLTYKYDGSDAKDTMDSDEKANLNQFWLKAGIGADIPVGGALYVRPEALFGYKLLSKLESDGVDSMEALPGVGKDTQTDIRIDIGVMLGYKL
jgi:hypothetical protein